MNKEKIKKYTLSFLTPLIMGLFVTYVIIFCLNNFGNSDIVYNFIEIIPYVLFGVIIGKGIGFIIFDLKKVIKNRFLLWFSV